MSNSRREFFLQTAVSTPLLFLVPTNPPAIPPLKDRPSPEFWFGDRVSYCWNDEDMELPYSETGEVIGVIWNPRENYWEYTVTWLSSTAYPIERYPVSDGTFFTAEELCKL